MSERNKNWLCILLVVTWAVFGLGVVGSLINPPVVHAEPPPPPPANRPYVKLLDLQGTAFVASTTNSSSYMTVPRDCTLAGIITPVGSGDSSTVSLLETTSGGETFEHRMNSGAALTEPNGYMFSIPFVTGGTMEIQVGTGCNLRVVVYAVYNGEL